MADTAGIKGSPTEAAPPTLEVSEALNPDVLRMENAHARGDFAEARALAHRLASSGDATLQAQGQTMLERHRIDPVIVAVLVGTGLLIVALAGMYLGAPPSRTSPPGRSAGADVLHGAHR